MNDARSGRGRRPAEAISGREALLDAAVPFFAVHGYEGTSLRALAALAGVDAALVVHQFGSKAALWEAAVDRLAERAIPGLDDLSRRLSSDRPVGERLAEFVGWFVDARAELPEFGLFLAGEFARPGRRQEIVRERLVRPIYATVRPLLEEANAAGIVRSSDPAVVFFTLASAISFSLAGAGMIAHLSDRADDPGTAPARIAAEVKATVLGTLLRPARPS